MTAPLFLSSGNLLADRRFAFAADLAARGDLAAAADLMQQALELAPDFVSAWFALGDVRERLGEPQEAAIAFRRAQAIDPPDRHGFDGRLERAEFHLRPDLGYRLSVLERHAIITAHAALRPGHAARH